MQTKWARNLRMLLQRENWDLTNRNMDVSGTNSMGFIEAAVSPEAANLHLKPRQTIAEVGDGEVDKFLNITSRSLCFFLCVLFFSSAQRSKRMLGTFSCGVVDICGVALW